MYMLGRELSRLGWRVSYLVGDYGQTPALRTEEGLMVHAAYEAGQHGALLGTATALRRFWHALEGVDAGVYITRGMTAQTGVVAAFARLRDKRSVFWFGKDADAAYAVPRLSGLPFSERIPAWYGMRNVSAVVCQTTQQLHLLRKYVGRQGELIRNISPWHAEEEARGPAGYRRGDA
ncbi:MAG: glycosyltransferase [Armatimonadota bacterium]